MLPSRVLDNIRINFHNFLEEMHQPTAFNTEVQQSFSFGLHNNVNISTSQSDAYLVAVLPNYRNKIGPGLFFNFYWLIANRGRKRSIRTQFRQFNKILNWAFLKLLI